MKLGIIGIGHVGTAVGNVLSHHYDVRGYDTKKQSDSLNDMESCDVLFICTPTPTQGENQDTGSILRTLKEFTSRGWEGIYVIKSTILPGTVNKFQKLFPKARIIHNPEFLSQRTAEKDFANMKRVILGGDDMKDLQLVGEIYARLGVKEAFYVSAIHAEFIKYLHNCFLATKVAVFNEFHQVAKSIGVEYQTSANIAADVTGWINKRHTVVPGPDGWFGYGGACFPKDMAAFTGKFAHLDLLTLEAAIKSNQIHRRREKPVEPTPHVVERVKLKPPSGPRANA